MQINDNYKIESDALNVTLYQKQRPRKATSKESWRAIAYFSNPQNALDYMIKNEIMGTGMADFKTVYEKIGELEGLVRTLKGLPELLKSAPGLAKS